MEAAADRGDPKLIVTTAFQLNISRSAPAAAVPDILVEFAVVQMKNKILKVAQEKDGLQFEYTIIYVYADIPAEILLARRRLQEVAAKFKEKRIKYRWLPLDHITTSLNGKTYTAHDKSTGGKLLVACEKP